MDFYTIEKYVIVVFGLLMAYAEFAQAIRYKKSWVKWGLGFAGIYWAVYYIYSIIRDYADIELSSHQIFVRSGIMLTLALVTASAFMTLSIYKRIK